MNPQSPAGPVEGTGSHGAPPPEPIIPAAAPPAHRSTAESRADHLVLLAARAREKQTRDREAELAAVVAALGKLPETRSDPDPVLQARVRVLCVAAFVLGTGLSVQAMLWSEPLAARLLGGLSSAALLAATVAAAVATSMTNRRLWVAIASGWVFVWAGSVIWLTLNVGLGWHVVLGSPFMAVSLLAGAVALLGAVVQAHAVRAEADRRRVNRRVAAERAGLEARRAAARPADEPSLQEPRSHQ